MIVFRVNSLKDGSNVIIKTDKGQQVCVLANKGMSYDIPEKMMSNFTGVVKLAGLGVVSINKIDPSEEVVTPIAPKPIDPKPIVEEPVKEEEKPAKVERDDSKKVKRGQVVEPVKEEEPKDEETDKVKTKQKPLSLREKIKKSKTSE